MLDYHLSGQGGGGSEIRFEQGRSPSSATVRPPPPPRLFAIYI